MGVRTVHPMTDTDTRGARFVDLVTDTDAGWRVGGESSHLVTDTDTGGRVAVFTRRLTLSQDQGTLMTDSDHKGRAFCSPAPRLAQVGVFAFFFLSPFLPPIVYFWRLLLLRWDCSLVPA